MLDLPRCAAFLLLVSAVGSKAEAEGPGAGRPSSDPAAASSAAAAQLPPIVVVGTTPVPGPTIDADKIPGNVQSLSAESLARDGLADLSGAINRELGSVSINDTLADPFQPDILYRGFEASPVLGTPQGLAVYQNGVRINEAFGDSVNWDLVPDIAVARIDLLSGSPLFGLNALGGALALTMKNGFSYEGADASLAGGSFNQRSGAGEFGFNRGLLGLYTAARIQSQDGWRHFAHDGVQQYYLDLGLHAEGATLDLSYARARNLLSGQGAAPLQSLALDGRNVFTGPQDNINALDALTLNASVALTRKTALQGVAYFRDFRQDVANG